MKKIKKKSYTITEKYNKPSIVDRLQQELLQKQVEEPIVGSTEAELIANRSEEEDWELIRKIHDQAIMELINKNS